MKNIELAPKVTTDSNELMLGDMYVTRVTWGVDADNTISQRVEHPSVICTKTYNDAMYTITMILSEALYSCIPCDRVQACAAAFSVPDGAPFLMAVDNIGCELNDDAAEFMHRGAAAARANKRAFARGPRH